MPSSRSHVQPHGRARFLPAGDAALVVELGDAIDQAANDRVLALDAVLAKANVIGLEETVPTYRSLWIAYDPATIGFEALSHRVESLLDQLPDPAAAPAGRCWSVPVVYGGAFGEDLAFVAHATGLSEEQVIACHAGAEYRVYMIGFQPGFAYLGGLDPRLHLPRRADPRGEVPAGSIAIGGMQSAVYSVACPSGWHLLGRAPVRVFDPRRRQPFLLSAGDRVRFRSLPADDWEPLAQRAEAGEIVAEEVPT